MTNTEKIYSLRDVQHIFINLHSDAVQAQKEVNRMIEFVEECRHDSEYIKLYDLNTYLINYLQKYFKDTFIIDAIHGFLSIKSTACQGCCLNSYCVSNIQDLMNTSNDYKVVYLPALLADLKNYSKNLECRKIEIVSLYYDVMDEMKKGGQDV